MDVYVDTKKISLSLKKAVGKGGEADVYNIGGGEVLKIFKTPDHPDYANLVHEQAGAEKRIRTHQKKLLEFPRNLPKKVIAPKKLAKDKNGKIVGYTMDFVKNAEPFIRYGDKNFRQMGIDNNVVVEIAKNLHQTVCGIHNANVVIGDFNDLNVLVLDKDVYVIDADSFQFSQYYCQMFTPKFLDPLLCDKSFKKMNLAKPYVKDSDWYAFCVMLMQSFLYVDPYGGIHKPKDKSKRLNQGERPLERITVFNKEVVYPKPAIHFKVLSDELLHYFYEVFEKDKRGEFPAGLLGGLNWQKCKNCGTEHARFVCPECNAKQPGIVKEAIQVRGKVIATRIFKTKGLILFAACENKKFRWLYHENGNFKREDNLLDIPGQLNPGMRFRIKDKETYIGLNGEMLTITQNNAPSKKAVDSFGTLPMFDANKNNIYWINNGQLLKQGDFGSDYIGDVLSNQTLFWTGDKFGFGFYRAGNMNVFFVFEAARKGINDNVKMPPIQGQLIDSTCFFGDDFCWFLVSMEYKGRRINQCRVINSKGKLEAIKEAEQGDGSWLGSLRGKCAVGKFLLAATDEGIVKIEMENNTLIKTKEFPDTADFVDSGCHLFPGSDCLFVVRAREIYSLKIK